MSRPLLLRARRRRLAALHFLGIKKSLSDHAIRTGSIHTQKVSLRNNPSIIPYRRREGSGQAAARLAA